MFANLLKCVDTLRTITNVQFITFPVRKRPFLQGPHPRCGLVSFLLDRTSVYRLRYKRTTARYPSPHIPPKTSRTISSPTWPRKEQPSPQQHNTAFPPISRPAPERTFAPPIPFSYFPFPCPPPCCPPRPPPVTWLVPEEAAYAALSAVLWARVSNPLWAVAEPGFFCSKVNCCRFFGAWGREGIGDCELTAPEDWMREALALSIIGA